MKLVIMPNVGVGPLLFGMDRAQVRRIIGGKFRVFGNEDKNDQYMDHGIHGHFDQNNHLEALEFATPAEPKLGTINLMSLKMFETRNLCRAAGGDFHDFSDGPISKVLGLGFWSPDAYADNFAPVESVIAFGPGYFEQYPPE